MNESIEMIKNRIKNKRNINFSTNHSNDNKPEKKLKYFKNLITRTLIAVIFILGTIIFTKYSTNNLLLYKKYVLNDTWKFTKVNELYQKYLGNVLPFDKIIKDSSKTVFNEKLVFKEKNDYHEGSELLVDSSYLTPAIKSGIVVFIGEKENYGNTIIIQGVDGVDVWYGNIENVKVKLYDYIEQGSLVGETIENKLYLVFQKEGKNISYEEYME